MHYSYCAHFEQDPNGGFLVTFTDVPETIMHGETMVEAKANAVEALGLALRGYLADERDIPMPSTKAGKVLSIFPLKPMTL